MINPVTTFIFSCDNDQFTWNVPEHLPYFEGHFKDNPVLPAVALVDLSLAIVNSIDSNLKKTFLTIKSAKFSEVIRPKDTLFIQMTPNSETNTFSMNFTNQHQVVVSKLVFVTT
jgi:3-hydroxymyristoyl/3-hydroxydecanoyl-(acyl carrier protein) dehydratase